MTFVESRLGRVDQTGNHILGIIYAHAVDDQVDILVVELSCCQIIIYSLEIIVYIDAGITFQLVGLELLLHRAPLAQMDGGHHHESGAFRELQHLLYHILRRVFLHLATTDGRIGMTYAGKQQA